MAQKLLKAFTESLKPFSPVSVLYDSTPRVLMLQTKERSIIKTFVLSFHLGSHLFSECRLPPIVPLVQHRPIITFVGL